MLTLVFAATAVVFQPAPANVDDVLQSRATENLKASGDDPDEVVCKSAKPTQATGSRLRRSTGKQICRKRIDWEMDEIAKNEFFQAVNENEGTGPELPEMFGGGSSGSDDLAKQPL